MNNDMKVILGVFSGLFRKPAQKKCPVCGGRGEVSATHYVPLSSCDFTQCRTCGGVGTVDWFVEVAGEKDFYAEDNAKKLSPQKSNEHLAT